MKKIYENKEELNAWQEYLKIVHADLWLAYRELLVRKITRDTPCMFLVPDRDSYSLKPILKTK